MLLTGGAALGNAPRVIPFDANVVVHTCDQCLARSGEVGAPPSLSSILRLPGGVPTGRRSCPQVSARARCSAGVAASRRCRPLRAPRSSPTHCFVTNARKTPVLDQCLRVARRRAAGAALAAGVSAGEDPPPAPSSARALAVGLRSDGPRVRGGEGVWATRGGRAAWGWRAARGVVDLARGASLRLGAAAVGAAGAATRGGAQTVVGARRASMAHDVWRGMRIHQMFMNQK